MTTTETDDEPTAEEWEDALIEKARRRDEDNRIEEKMEEIECKEE